MAILRAINSLLLNKQVPLEYTDLDMIFILLAIRELMEFDKDGKPTGKLAGYGLDLVDTKNFTRIKAKIPLIELKITQEELQQARENGQRVFVELEEGVVKQYLNSNNNTIQDSITAKNFHIVETNL